jgi:hypothetical protein
VSDDIVWIADIDAPNADAWTEQVRCYFDWCGIDLKTKRTVFHSGPGPVLGHRVKIVNQHI